MFRSWMMLGIEANRVIGLRTMKLMRGGITARREARLMVAEKMRAALEANARMIAGASAEEIIRTYRRRVAANAKRLAKPDSVAVLRRRRRKRKWL
jgi:hypothetical protein